MAYIYRHIRLDTNMPFYIGLGTDNEGKHTRAKNRCSRSKYWKNIVKLAGYRIDIIVDDICDEEIEAKEIEFITLYGREDLGLGTLINLTDGGDGRLGTKMTDEHKNKLLKSREGKIPYNKGQKMSKEFCIQMSLRRKGKKLTPQHIERKYRYPKGHTPWNKGKTYKNTKAAPLFTEERKEKMAASSEYAIEIICLNINKNTWTKYISITKASKSTGVNITSIRHSLKTEQIKKGFVFYKTRESKSIHPQKGTKHSEEAKLKMADESKINIPVDQYTLNGVFIKSHKSITQAAKEINSSDTNLSAHIRGKHHECKGWIFTKQGEIPKKTYKLIDQYDLEGNLIETYIRQKEIVEKLGLRYGDIQGVLSGRRKSTHGFVFKYRE